MKAFEIIKLKESINYLNIEKGCLGIILNNGKSKSRVVLFNNTNKDEYSIVEVENKKLEATDQVLPNKIEVEIKKLVREDKMDVSFSVPVFKEYDNVKLIANKPQYAKYNIFEGAIGIVAENYIVKNKVLVDFTEITKDNKVTGGCIPVDINDLVKLD